MTSFSSRRQIKMTSLELSPKLTILQDDPKVKIMARIYTKIFSLLTKCAIYRGYSSFWSEYEFYFIE